MKILHTSDWHLGAYIKGFSLQEDQAFLFDQLIQIIQDRQVDCLLVSGDVYDTVTSRAEAIALYDRVMTRICGDLGVPAVVIAGNHDGAERLAAGAALLKKAGLHVFGRIRLPIQPVYFGKNQQVAVYAVPYFHPDEVRAALQRAGDDERSAAIRTPEDAFAVVVEQIRTTMDNSKFNVLMAHMTVLHAERSDSERSLSIGMVESVSASLLEGFDYVALGHIHKPQKVAGHEYIRYSGSMQIMSFGAEERQTKSMVLVDTDTGNIETIPLHMRRPFLTLEGTLAEVQAQLGDHPDTYLEVRVTDQMPSPEVQASMRSAAPLLTTIMGKQDQPVTALSRISQQQLTTMSEEALLCAFLEENGMPLPTDLQWDLFRSAWKTVQEGEVRQ